MIIAIFFLVGAGLLIIQTSILPLLPEWMGRPDLLFVLIVYAALRLEIYQGAFLALLFGMVLDIFSGPFLGLHPLIFLTLFVILKTMAANLVIHETVHQVPLTLGSYLFASSGLYICASLLMPENTIIWSWRALLMQLFLLAIFTIPLFGIYDKLRARFLPKKQYSSLGNQPGSHIHS
jgi:rod shape-determining protein MreD